MAMDKNYVLSHIGDDKNKSVFFEQTHTEVDENGELRRVVSHQKAKVSGEPDYIKLYTDCQLAFKNLDLSLSPYIVSFARFMSYANDKNAANRSIVRTGKLEREAVAADVGVSVSMVDKVIKKLVATDIFIPVIRDGKKYRGYYFVNPWVLAKGDWKDIKQLRAQFEFVSGSSSSMVIDNDGEARVLIAEQKPLIADKGKKRHRDDDVLEGQMTFNDFPELIP